VNGAIPSAITKMLALREITPRRPSFRIVDPQSSIVELSDSR
jgi:hypothetical protein